MGAPAWGGDPNPLTALFRVAYGRLREELDLAKGGARVAPQGSAAQSQLAAEAMQRALEDIHGALTRSAHQQFPKNEIGKEALLYAFAAVADELLSYADWPGAAAWPACLLERRVFDSQLSGRRLFEQIEQTLLAPRSRLVLEMAGLYLDCLNLGFQGKYRDAVKGSKELDELRQKLFVLLYPHAPGFEFGAAERAHLLVTAPAQRAIGNPARWYLWPLGVLALPLLASAGVWFHLHLKLADILDAIERIPKP